MTNDRLAGYWKNMYLIVDEAGKDYLLAKFFNIKECLGEHRGGIFFIARNQRGEEESLILRCDEGDYCYKKVANTGDDDQDWKQVGLLIEALGPDSMPPYT